MYIIYLHRSNATLYANVLTMWHRHDNHHIDFVCRAHTNIADSNASGMYGIIMHINYTYRILFIGEWRRHHGVTGLLCTGGDGLLDIGSSQWQTSSHYNVSSGASRKMHCLPDSHQCFSMKCTACPSSVEWITIIWKCWYLLKYSENQTNNVWNMISCDVFKITHSFNYTDGNST